MVVNASCPVRYQNVEKHVPCTVVLYTELALALHRPTQLAQVLKHFVRYHLHHCHELVLVDLLSMIVPRRAFGTQITAPGGCTVSMID